MKSRQSFFLVNTNISADGKQTALGHWIIFEASIDQQLDWSLFTLPYKLTAELHTDPFFPPGPVPPYKYTMELENVRRKKSAWPEAILKKPRLTVYYGQELPLLPIFVNPATSESPR